MLLIYLSIAWCVGIVCATRFPTVGAAWIPFALVGLVVAVVYRHTRPIRIAGLIILCASLGIWRALSAQPANTEDQLAHYNDSGNSEAILTAVIDDVPEQLDSGLRLRVKAVSIQADAYSDARTVTGYALVTTDRLAKFAYGDLITIHGQMLTPPVFDTFSYREYLARSGVVSVVNKAELTRLKQDQGNPITALLLNFKASSTVLIRRLIPAPRSDLLTGILLGDDSGLTPEIKSAFQITGTSHLIAISGANIAVVITLLLGVFTRLTGKNIGTGLTIVGVILYTLVVGASGSVIRAAIMGSMVIVAQRVGRRADGLTSVAASFWLMTLVNPTWLFDAGLILSAAATTGLILYSKPITDFIESFLSRLFHQETVKGVLAVLSELVILTIAAQITTLPISMYLFGQVSTVSLWVNILVAPAQALIMTLGILTVLFSVVWFPLGQIMAFFVDLPLAYTLSVIRAASVLPGASTKIEVSLTTLLIYFAGLVVVTITLMQKRESLGKILTGLVRGLLGTSTLFFLGGASAILVWVAVLARPDGLLHVTFLAVGEGHAVLIQTPHGVQILVDGGDNPTRLATALGDRLPLTKREIDALIVTGTNPILTAALPPLLDRLPVQRVITHQVLTTEEAYNSLLDRLRASNKEVVNVDPNQSIIVDDGVSIQFLGAEGTPLGLRVTFGESSFVIMPEMKADQLRSISKVVPSFAATVVEVPSNGAEPAVSTDWVLMAPSQVAVITAESGNPNSQPSENILKRLDPRPTYRTDRQGAIHFSTDGHQLWISTER